MNFNRIPHRLASGLCATAMGLGAVVGLSPITSTFAEAEPQQERPNILVIMPEDTSAHLGCYGDPLANTPRLDELASRGVRFTNVFTASGVCAPSRASFLTGMYTESFGAQHMRTENKNYKSVVPEGMKAFPEWMRAEGYYTFTSGKLDYQYSHSLFESGPFTIWDYEDQKYPAEQTDSYTPLWRNREDSEQPFFGEVNFLTTHESGIIFLKDGTELVTDPSAVELPPYYPDTELARRTMAQHYDNIHMMDTQVGAVLDMLEEDGLADDTIILFTTDHGDCLPRGKRELYDTGTKVPMILYVPEKWRTADYEAGSVCDDLISFVDMAPTILHMAGIEIPDYMEGQIVFGSDKAEPRQYVYAARDRMSEAFYEQKSVRDSRYRYIYNYDFGSGRTGAQHVDYRDQLDFMQELWSMHEKGQLTGDQLTWFDVLPEEELYDLEADPWELHNLAADPAYADTLERMRGALKDFLSVYPDSGLTEDEMIAAWYPNGVQPITEIPNVYRSYSDTHTVWLKLEGVTSSSSVGYRIKGVDRDGYWHLYAEPFEVPAGSEIEVKAVRYGYAESPVITVRLNEQPAA